MRRIDAVAHEIVDAAFQVHQALGPGLLESAYKACLVEELAVRKVEIAIEVPLPLIYREAKLECGYRADIIAERLVLVETKAVDALHPIHEAQMLTYLRLSGLRLGLLINFNVELIKHGIRRLIL